MYILLTVWETALVAFEYAPPLRPLRGTRSTLLVLAALLSAAPSGLSGARSRKRRRGGRRVVGGGFGDDGGVGGVALFPVGRGSAERRRSSRRRPPEAPSGGGGRRSNARQNCPALPPASPSTTPAAAAAAAAVTVAVAVGLAFGVPSTSSTAFGGDGVHQCSTAAGVAAFEEPEPGAPQLGDAAVGGFKVGLTGCKRIICFEGRVRPQPWFSFRLNLALFFRASYSLPQPKTKKFCQLYACFLGDVVPNTRSVVC